MQTSSTHASVAARARTVCAYVLACVLLVLAALCVYAACAPGSAFAKEYSCEGVDIDAIVTDNGALAVAETRTYEFSGSYSLVGMVFDPPRYGELGVVGVTVQRAGGSTEQLEEIEFDTKWRSAGGPGKGHYSVDEARDTVYCFWDYADDEYAVTVAYSYTNAISIYRDTAELYWQFVGKEWEVDPDTVTMNLTLPVPDGQTVAGSDNVFAWGHGSLDGSVRFDDEGHIVYNAPRVSAGEFVEARVAFPPSWVSKAPDEVRSSTPKFATIMAEEQEWADNANRERVIARIIGFGPGVLSLGALIWCIVVFFRHGREYKTQFSGDYWRDVPEKGLEPAVVGRIVRWNDKSTDDFTATLMCLSAKGVIRMDKSTYERERLLGGTKTIETYALAKTHAGEQDMTDLERRAYALVFDKIGRGADRVEFDRIKKYGKDHPESFVNAMDNWQNKVSMQVNKAGVFEAAGEHWSKVFKVVPVVLVGAAFVFWYTTENWLPVASVLPCSIIMFFMSGKIRRRSPVAAEVDAKSKALKRWFKDFTNLKEAIPTDTKVWGELLVYAYLLGVADEVVKQLKIALPTLWEDDWFYHYSYWYWMPDSTPSFARAFDTTFASAVSTARTAISAASDGGGGGGGFSGGGGGGFGGGGGGFAR